MNDDGGDDDEDVANQLTVELRLPIQAKRLLRFLLIPPEQVIVEPIRRRGGAFALLRSTGLLAQKVYGQEALSRHHSAALRKCVSR